MRYYEFAGHGGSCKQHGPHNYTSLYVVDSEFADCAAIIRHHDGRVVGVTKVPVGGMTLQVLCSTVDAAHELFASWLDYTRQGPRRAGRLERGARLSVQRR